MHYLRNFTLSVLLLLPFLMIAQKPPIKFGKIDEKNLKQTEFEIDKEADAVVIADYGRSHFVYNDSKNTWQIKFTRHKRVKILSKEGYEQANVSINYYSPETGGEEKISSLKAATYNLENGKIVKHKLSSEAEFDENFNKYWKTKKFTLPNVKVGSIIEYTYIVTSDFIRQLRSWEFQSNIPILWSEYKVIIPQFFKYQFLSQGYEPLLIDEEERQQESFVYSWTTGQQFGGKVEKGKSSLESLSYSRKLISKNIPAFKPEPFISTTKNYISKISFELLSVQYPNESMKKMMGDWKTLNKTFLKSIYFGQPIDHSSFLNKIVDDIIKEEQTDIEKMASVYSYIKNNISFNGFEAKYLTSSLKKVLDTKSGSSADINLLMVAMLRKAGLKANPVLISTRNNGFVRKSYALSGQFNSVVCKVYFEDSYLLIDGTNSFLPINVLPEKCLNDMGWVVSETESGWVNLTSNQKQDVKFSGEITIEPSGKLSGKLSESYNGFVAGNYRKNISNQGKESYITNLKSNSSFEMSDVNISGDKDLYKPLAISYDFETDENEEEAVDVIYLDPFITNKLTENHFKVEERKYPVDFSSIKNYSYYFTYNLPEGYVAEELPAPVAVVLPNAGGKLVYSTSMAGNKVVVMMQYRISKPVFIPEEYPYLKAFFAQIVAKQAEQIVLKKQ